MTLKKRRVIGCFCFALACAACSDDKTVGPSPTPDSGMDTGGSNPGDSGPDVPPGDTRPCETSTIAEGTFTLSHGGLDYGYIVHVPPSYDGTKRTPLVLNWHGRNSTATEEQILTGTDLVANDEGFIIVYPNSPDKSWAAGTCCPPKEPEAGVPEGGFPEHDDVGFARALVAEISSKACIDSKRVYSTGLSNGGFLSYRLACEAADLFAAVVPVAATVGIPTCTPSRAVPIMHHHGTADMTIPYGVSAWSAEGLDVPGTVRNWAMRDGCTKGPDTTFQMGTVTCQTWSQCNGGALVTLCTAEGSDHCWPGGLLCPNGMPYTKDISAGRDGWAFMKQFVLP